MHCKRCRVKMRLSPTVHHRKRKWICPKCGRARMQGVEKPRGARKGRGGRSRADD
ncbi:MAG: hypothetical protein ACYTKD_24550 [Planctomycetota bacterium]